MADFLTLNGMPVGVLTVGARKLAPTRIGKSSRSHGGQLRSTQRLVGKDSWSFETEPYSLSELEALQYAAPDGEFASCGGFALGITDEYSTKECQVIYGDAPFEEDEPGVSFKQTIQITLIEV